MKNISVSLILLCLTGIGAFIKLDIWMEHQQLKGEISAKANVYNNVSVAITKLRTTRELARNKCDYYPEASGTLQERYLLSEARIKAQGALIETDCQVFAVFGEEVGSKVGDEIYKFNEFDIGAGNPCKQDKELGSEYRKRADKILTAMRTAIDADKKCLQNIFCLLF